MCAPPPFPAFGRIFLFENESVSSTNPSCISPHLPWPTPHVSATPSPNLASHPISPSPIHYRTQLSPPPVRYRAIKIQSFFTSQHWTGAHPWRSSATPCARPSCPRPSTRPSGRRTRHGAGSGGRRCSPLSSFSAPAYSSPSSLFLASFSRQTLRAGRSAPIGGFRRCPSMAAGGQISSRARST